MKIGMTYKDIIKYSPKGSEAKMWDAVDRVDCLIEKLRKEDPEMAREFLEGEYEAMNGKHINEWLAKEMVEKMWHKDKNGVVTSGTLVDQEDSKKLLENVGSQDKVNAMKWDAFVAANAFMHDLANSGLTKSEIMNLAKLFWFHDDDMGAEGCHRVYWYFKDWIFE